MLLFQEAWFICERASFGSSRFTPVNVWWSAHVKYLLLLTRLRYSSHPSRGKKRLLDRKDFTFIKVREKKGEIADNWHFRLDLNLRTCFPVFCALAFHFAARANWMCAAYYFQKAFFCLCIPYRELNVILNWVSKSFSGRLTPAPHPPFLPAVFLMRILSISATIVAEIAQSQETCKHLVQVEKRNPMKGKGIMPENRQKHKQLIAVGGMQLKTNLGGSQRAPSHETDQGLHTIIKIIKQDKINKCDSRLEAKLSSCSASSPRGFLPTHSLSMVLSFITFIGSICLVLALWVDCCSGVRILKS